MPAIPTAACWNASTSPPARIRRSRAWASPFDGATPADLYPTDIYTNEYDGFADFPKYPIDFLSDLNAFLGILFDHITYLDPEPGQLADAIQLPTSTADTLTNYYMVPEDLPLLDPLRLIPVIGNPLADLLQPDMSVLVNLGYGSIQDGWSPGDADVPSPMGLFPTDVNLSDVFTALVNGIPQGITAAIKDLAGSRQLPSHFVDPGQSDDESADQHCAHDGLHRRHRPAVAAEHPVAAGRGAERVELV